MKFRLLSLAWVLVMSGAMAFGQGTAQISGTVTDPTGARLPGVDVTATQTATGAVRTVVSNETGTYTMQALPIGPYRLEVSLPGFQTYVQTGIQLEVNTTPVFNVMLQVGQVVTIPPKQ